uniref:C2H2-type domain-containing protein n=2 Tax=Dicentrarchus labrax TaxID=13489 RepID=A0A8C4E6P0_DICLA
MLIPANELSEPSEPQPEPESDHQLLYNNAHVAESRDQNRVKQEDSGSTGNVQKKPKKMHQKSKSHNNKVSNRNFQRNTSTGKKLIQCDTCGKYFKYKSELILHLRTHTGEKPFTCKTCGKSFRRRSHLKQHMGVHTREKAYSCNTCGEKFVHIRELNTHTRTHTDEKPHSCVTCGKGYIQIQSLKKHIEVVHTG